MAEQTQEHIVRIALNNRITVGMWETYSGGRAEYASGKDSPDMNIARYYGARALYKAGFVTVEGFQPLIDALSAGDHKTVELGLMGVIIDYISIPIEVEINRPLETYLRKSWPTEAIRINDTVLRHSSDISTPETTT